MFSTNLHLMGLSLLACVCLCRLCMTQTLCMCSLRVTTAGVCGSRASKRVSESYMSFLWKTAADLTLRSECELLQRHSDTRSHSSATGFTHGSKFPAAPAVSMAPVGTLCLTQCEHQQRETILCLSFFVCFFLGGWVHKKWVTRNWQVHGGVLKQQEVVFMPVDLAQSCTPSS